MKVSKEKAAVVVAKHPKTLHAVFATDMFLDVAGPEAINGESISEEDALKIISTKAQIGTELSKCGSDDADAFWVIVDDHYYNLLGAKIKTSPIMGSVVFGRYDDNTKSVQKIGYLK